MRVIADAIVEARPDPGCEVPCRLEGIGVKAYLGIHEFSFAALQPFVVSYSSIPGRAFRVRLLHGLNPSNRASRRAEAPVKGSRQESFLWNSSKTNS